MSSSRNIGTGLRLISSPVCKVISLYAHTVECMHNFSFQLRKFMRGRYVKSAISL